MKSPVPATTGSDTPSTTFSAKRTARWLLAGITALAMAATAALGVWQLQRAAFKESLASQIESQAKLAPLQEIPAGDTQALVHQRVNLRGAWLHQHTVFLDNRYMGGRPGFIVATPLQLDNGKQVVWVQRGWLARDPQDRTRLPSLPNAAQPVTVQGRVVPEVSRVYALGTAVEAPATAPAAQAPAVQAPAAQAPAAQTSAPGPARDARIWQNLPAVDFGPSTQLISVAVLQTAPEESNPPDGLQRDWTPLDSGVAKHYGYAFQWFALCGLIMVLYAWFQFIAPRRRTF
jgi:surfeit locus 1 family protein